MPTPDIFKALAEPIRHRLLQVLIAQELSVTELVEVMDQPQSTISRHLKVLRDAELLVDRKSGPTTFYAARPVNPTSNGNGHGHLSDRLLHWLASEPIEAFLQERLRDVLARRRGGPNFFETIGDRWDQLRVDAFGESFHLEALTALLPREWTVADIGTGTGYLLPCLAARFLKIIAVDPAANMLELACQRPEIQNARNISFRAGSLEKLPMADDEVDLAIASLVLHHVTEPSAAMREIARTIRLGGRLLLVEQYAHEYQSFHDRMGDVWWGFEPAQVRNWGKRAGFEDLQIHPLSTVHPNGKNIGEAPPLFAMTAVKTSKKS